MKKIISIIIIILFISCKTNFIDDKSNKIIKNDFFELSFSEFKNTLLFKPTITATADKSETIYQGFEISIPKKLESYLFVSHYFLLNYGDDQTIIIDSGYKKKSNIENEFKVEDVGSKEMSYYKDKYSYKKNKKEYFIGKLLNDRMTKKYTNGKVIIFMYNIKQENFKPYLDLLTNFKYN